MRIGMRLLLGYFLIVAIAAWFVLSIFVQEVKPGVRRATEGTLNDTATLLAALAREDLLAADPQQGRLAQAFHQLNQQPLNANIGGIKKVRNEYRVYLTDARGKVVFDSSGQATEITRRRFASTISFFARRAFASPKIGRAHV